MKNLLLTFCLLFLATFSFAQEEELIPGAVVGSCIDPDNNMITIIFDYNKNCPEADPTGFLAGAEELGFHSGINNWATAVAFDSDDVMNLQSIGNGIYQVEINTMDYYGSALADITEFNFVLRSTNTSDSWEAGSCRDDVGGGGFGGDEPCNDFKLVTANLPTCAELAQESSKSILGATTIANSCIDTTTNSITIDFDLSKNCPEADPNGDLAGTSILGFHSGANSWSSQVDWDDPNAAQAVNQGNDVYSLTINPMDYYGVALSDLDNIMFILNNGISDPGDPWTISGRDERDGGFGGTEPCSDLSLIVSELGFCVAEPVLNTSAAILEPTGDDLTCKDPATGKIRIGFDLSLNCPEADTLGELIGASALGFHSGANEWAIQVPWNDTSAMQAVNNGSDIFTVTVDVMDYYGISYDSLSNIRFLLNNGPTAPDAAWDATGRDDRDAESFGSINPCSDLTFDIAEVPTCDLFVPEPGDKETSDALLSDMGSSCIDNNFNLVKVAFDLSQNCPEADTANLLLGTPALGFHSGANNWEAQVAWNADGAKNAVNDGNNVFSVVINPAEYYGLPMDEIDNIEFLLNNGVADPDNPWILTGKDIGAGGFGGEDPCKNLLIVFSELPSCDLSETATSHALLNGAAASCVDSQNGLIQIDFDLSLNCPEADTTNAIAGLAELGFHSGINEWQDQVAWDAENAKRAVNDGNDKFSVTINPMEYYGKPLAEISTINFLFNVGPTDPDNTWNITGKDSRDGSGFGGAEPCSNFLFQLDEAPACDLSTNTENIVVKESFKVYPNPFTNEVSIEFANPKSENFTLQINDIAGKVVRTIRNINTSKITISRGNLSAGIYFAQLVDAQGNYATTKLVIQD